MTAFGATFDANGFNGQLASLSRMNQFGAFSRALSRAGQSMNKQAITEVQTNLNLAAKEIREVITLKRVYRGDFTADVRITWKPLGLAAFKGTRATRRRGLSVKIKKTGSRKYVSSGFLATADNGKLLALRRRFVGGRQVGRKPLDTLYSTNVRQSFDDAPMQRRVLDAGLKRFREELTYEINRRLNSQA